ncbi:MAG: glycosyltransferase family 2 protein [Candidatus Diapherotrites archaeon]|nr:glycosyltransferase family 2 protein [Candidatus Diapherotrites archaeon]
MKSKKSPGKKQEMASIIIASANRKEFILDCLKSIKENTKYANLEVLVFDEASIDGSVKAIRQKFPWVKLFENGRVIGHQNINNLGFEKAKGNYIMLLNNDTIVVKGWLENAVKELQSNEKIASVGCELISEGQFKNNSFVEKPAVEKMSVCSGAMLLRKSAVEKIGNWDSKNFHPIYGGETDWCYRARHFGYRHLQLRNSFVVHRHNPKKKKNKHERMELLYTHGLRAMFFNLSTTEFLKMLPGLGMVFAKSIRKGTAPDFLKCWWNNLLDVKRILRERKKRLARQKILGMDLKRIDEELSEYKDIKAARIRDGSDMDQIV